MKSKLILSIALLTCIPALAQNQAQLDNWRKEDKNVVVGTAACGYAYDPVVHERDYRVCRSNAALPFERRFFERMEGRWELDKGDPKVAAKRKALALYHQAVKAQIHGQTALEHEYKDSYHRRQYDAAARSDVTWSAFEIEMLY